KIHICLVALLQRITIDYLEPDVVGHLTEVLRQALPLFGPQHILPHVGYVALCKGLEESSHGVFWLRAILLNQRHPLGLFRLFRLFGRLRSGGCRQKQQCEDYGDESDIDEPDIHDSPLRPAMSWPSTSSSVFA